MISRQTLVGDFSILGNLLTGEKYVLDGVNASPLNDKTLVVVTRLHRHVFSSNQTVQLVISGTILSLVQAFLNNLITYDLIQLKQKYTLYTLFQLPLTEENSARPSGLQRIHQVPKKSQIQARACQSQALHPSQDPKNRTLDEKRAKLKGK